MVSEACPTNPREEAPGLDPGAVHTTGEYPETGSPNGNEYNSPSPHYPSLKSNPEFALTEGWAEYLPTAIQDDDEYVTYDTFHFEDQNFYESYRDIESPDNYGHKIEGAVANVLYDLSDDGQSGDRGQTGVDDDEVADAFQKVWEVMKFETPDNMTDFRRGWIAQGYSYDDAVSSVFSTHGIPPKNRPDEPDFDVVNLTVGKAVAGQTTEITALVTNEGKANGTYEAVLKGLQDRDEITYARKSVRVPAGKSRTVTFRYTFPSPGTEYIRVGAAATSVEVKEATGTPSLNVTETALNRTTISAGQAVKVRTTVENSGSAEGTELLELGKNGTVVGSKNVSLAAGENTTVQFVQTFETAGVYTLTVDGNTAGTVTVEKQDSCEELTVIQAVAALDSDNTSISYDEYRQAYTWYYYDEEVPNTGGETISYQQMKEIQDSYYNDEYIEPCASQT